MDWFAEHFEPETVEKMLEKFRGSRATAVVLAEAGNERFGAWLLLVDRELRSYGVSHRDLADWTWRDAYDDGVAPAEAAWEAMGADSLGAMLR